MVSKVYLSSRSVTNPYQIQVGFIRNDVTESFHNVHAVVCDRNAQIIMEIGDSKYQTFIRSALKPLQAILFLVTGAAGRTNFRKRSLAIACGSHDGNISQVRESFFLLNQWGLNVNLLQCPIPVGRTSVLEHNCSGKHAAFLVTCKHMNWDLDSYLQKDHPLQQQIIEYVRNLLGINWEELIISQDDCGAPTISLKLDQIAFLYASMSSIDSAETKEINEAMLLHPDLIAGYDRFDTELMKIGCNQILSKGGAEGIQCISHLKNGMGVAIKVQDGNRRAKQAIAIHIIRLLQWINPLALEELEFKFFGFSKSVHTNINQELYRNKLSRLI
uniref:Asparaginase n=1 Tax=Paulinella chromatophora TaxID=39717 RepID=B1X5L0_PAUCH|nr:hypothetical protein PCC_0815 [Paulinella chromatophora]ACB43229.1 hypothetical protein PCC_0815 [Paulinella chromatophora]